MKTARVLSCTPNKELPPTARNHERKLVDGRLDLGPTFNAMRANQDETHRQLSFYSDMASNSINHMGSAISALAQQQAYSHGLQGSMLGALGGIANGVDNWQRGR